MDIRNILYQIAVFLVGILAGITFTWYFVFNNITPQIQTQNSIINQTIGEVVFPLVAITSDGKGTLEYGKLKITPGSGDAYISINPFIEPDTQYAFENAIKAACKLTKIDCSRYDFFLNIESNATLVGGPSAGLSFALAAYYALQNKTFPISIAATGTIDHNGNIGPVGGIFEKAVAAAQADKKIFLVPPGQSIVYRYERVEKKYEPFPGFVFIQVEYKPIPVNLSDFFWENYKMKIVEVSNLKEAIDIIEKAYNNFPE